MTWASTSLSFRIILKTGGDEAVCLMLRGVPGIRIDYGVSLRSLRLGLIGKADVVEFHRRPDGSWCPFPVEYKRGKPKVDDCDKVQLCAQAICLEEMLSVAIPEGALFYG